ncbi:unnamed protein product, partial [Nesidiocoris tenuis]
RAFPSKRDIWPSPTRSWGQRDTTLQSGTVPPKAGRLVHYGVPRLTSPGRCIIAFQAITLK